MIALALAFWGAKRRVPSRDIKDLRIPANTPCQLRSTTANYPFLEKPGIIGRY